MVVVESGSPFAARSARLDDIDSARRLDAFKILGMRIRPWTKSFSDCMLCCAVMSETEVAVG